MQDLFYPGAQELHRPSRDKTETSAISHLITQLRAGNTHGLTYSYHLAKNGPAEEIAEIYRNMEIKGLTHIYCQACSEGMKPEQARRSSTGLIMSGPCYMCNDTDATQAESDQALEEDLPGYLASFNHQ